MELDGRWMVMSERIRESFFGGSLGELDHLVSTIRVEHAMSISSESDPNPVRNGSASGASFPVSVFVSVSTPTTWNRLFTERILWTSFSPSD